MAKADAGAVVVVAVEVVVAEEVAEVGGVAVTP